MKCFAKVFGKKSFVLVFTAYSIFFACCFIQTARGNEPGHLMSVALNKGVLSGTVENGVRVIPVKAFQYGYSPSVIVVKKGERVRLELTSSDVTHGFGVAELKINVQIPAHAKEPAIYEFTPQVSGEFRVYCSVYCGTGHEEMHATLKVIE